MKFLLLALALRQLLRLAQELKQSQHQGYIQTFRLLLNFVPTLSSKKLRILQ